MISRTLYFNHLQSKYLHNKDPFKETKTEIETDVKTETDIQPYLCQCRTCRPRPRTGCRWIWRQPTADLTSSSYNQSKKSKLEIVMIFFKGIMINVWHLIHNFSSRERYPITPRISDPIKNMQTLEFDRSRCIRVTPLDQWLDTLIWTQFYIIKYPKLFHFPNNDIPSQKFCTFYCNTKPII